MINLVRSQLRKSLIKTVHLETLPDADINMIASPKKLTGEDFPDIPAQFLVSDQESIETISFLTHPLYTAFLKQAIFEPNYNAIFTKNRHLVIESMPQNRLRSDKFSLRKLYLKKHPKIRGVSTLFRGHEKSSNYYHCLINHLPRLYLLHQYNYQNISKIQVLVGGSLNKIEQFFVPKLFPENCQLKVVEPNQFYHVEKIILPSFVSLIRYPYLSQDYLNFFQERVCPQRPRHKVNRIFISRPNSKPRHILNEEELCQVLQNYGFKKYVLDEMPIEQQIELFYDAEYVIAAHGAGLSNIIFSEDIHLLEIFPYVNMNAPHYYYLAKSLGHRYCYSSGHRSSPQSLGFTANLSEIQQILCNIT